LKFLSSSEAKKFEREISETVAVLTIIDMFWHAIIRQDLQR
jgi:hypothetical protein